jgi:hypothetical protein
MKNEIKLYLSWKEPISRERFLIGLLEKNNGLYEFKYLDEFQEAKEKGCYILDEFLDENKTYKSEKMFLTFSNRLPNRKRKDFKLFLSERGFSEEVTDLEILKETRGVLATDTLELLEVLPNVEDKCFYFECYIVGMRHHINDVELEEMDKEDKITIVHEQENKYDKYAIYIETEKRKKIGYLPRCYTEKLYKLVDEKLLQVKIKRIVKSEIKKNPSMDIKIGLQRG